MEDYRKIAIELGQTLISKAPETRKDVERMLPELKESEDERIGKELIEFVKSRGGFKQEYIAWIEEQANHANFRNKIQIGDKVTRNEDGVLVNLSQLSRVAKKDEKQGEQKPAWSEEDEIGLLDALWAIQQARTIAKDENDMGNIWYAENWLKSLKDRVQPKQEWGEEDEKLYNDLSDTCFYNDEDYPEETYKLMLKRVLDWMNKRAKSLRPQNRWKPSDEQMEALNYVINLMASSKSPKENDYYYNVFKGLREQLKKL